MSGAAAADFIASGLIVLTAVAAVRDFWRRRETHRLDILLIVALIAIGRIRQPLGPVGWAALLARPFALLRLASHFRAIPDWLLGLALSVPIASLIPLAFWRSALPVPAFYAIVWYQILGAASAAVLFTKEAKQSTGLGSRRLALAALATWLLATDLAPSVMWPFVGNALRHVNDAIGNWVHNAMYVCYYLAFSTPRWLLNGWQRAEQAKYLSLAADLDPEARGQRTAEDLAHAAAGAVSNTMTLVALRETPSTDELVVKAAADHALEGLRVDAHLTVVGRAYHSRKSQRGSTADCGEGLSERLSPFGLQVLAAPVATPTHSWGVLLLVQRRGSVFPEDDLMLLEQLGRHAGTALDHAQLVAEARERERKAADRRIREAESRMSLMLDNIRDYAMFVLDHRGHIVTWHTGAQHVFGYSAAEIADEPAAMLFGMTEVEFDRLLNEALALGYAEREGPCHRRDGARFIGATIIRPLSGDDRDLRGFVAVTRDISERRELEQRLRQGQKMEAIGRLAGGIAHDFNNMLTVILGNADFLQQSLGGDPVHAPEVANILSAADRAAGLTRQLLAFSRQHVLQPVPINLTRLAAELLPMVTRVIGEHIEIVEEMTGEVAPVLGDRSQLEQLILNLALNARDAMPAGGRLTIRTSTVWIDSTTAGAELLPGPHALLEVTDTGVGMDEETASRIFEPFFTTKEFGRGTGLGLATVYGIVKQMGGAVRVTTAPNQGSTFRLYFPETRAAAPPPSRLAVVESPGGSETLLLVEDEPAVRAFLTEVLERHGYRVVGAADRAEALALAQSHAGPIHLVIADVVMPGGTGPDLVRALAMLRPGLPALYISGYADLVPHHQGLALKASHFLQKPFSASDLLLRIRQILARTATAPQGEDPRAAGENP